MKKLLSREWRCIAAVLIAFTLAGCMALSKIGNGIEVCYEHPKYGRVCVKIGGKVYTDPKLTEEEKREVLKWAAEQDSKPSSTP